MKYLNFRAMVWLCLLSSSTIAQSLSDNSNHRDTLKPDFWAYKALNLPDLSKLHLSGVIKVAVVDDGFRLTHHSLSDYWYRNKGEIPGNGIDDDNNGYIDDVCGWDIEDNDPDVSPPEGKESFLFHGTMSAGSVVAVAERCFGKQAASHIKIIPVKVVSDKSEKPYYELGYEGIAYAIQQNADIILCAWSGGKYDSEKYHTLFLEAQRKGILILASAGNFYSERCDPPASINSVYAVAALDSSLRKTTKSNYGEKIDLVAAGELVYAPYSIQDNTFSYFDGTSSAVSLIGGCAAVLKAINPEATPVELMDALKNTATPVDSMNQEYGGKLGAGMPNLTAAVSYLKMKSGRSVFFNSHRPEGDILIEQSSERTSWDINPFGGYKGFNFNLKGEWNTSKSLLQFYSGDSLIASYSFENFPAKVFIRGNQVRVQLTGKRSKKPILLAYSSVPVDSTTLYCSGTQYLDTNVGDFDDGSLSANYMNNASCKWQIVVPDGKHIRLSFDEFDTQPKTDFVWLFEGTETLQENLLGRFSGPDLPPVIISRSNKVLIWFVTDNKGTAKGWHLSYKATDELPGILPPVHADQLHGTGNIRE